MQAEGLLHELPHCLGLKQMAALVLRHDFQTCPNGESQDWNKGILVPDANHVVGTGSRDKLPRDLVTAKEFFEDLWSTCLAGSIFLGA